MGILIVPLSRSSTACSEKVAVAGGISIRGEPHDLVFVGVEIKTQVERDQRIENADRIASPLFPGSFRSCCPEREMR